MLAYTLRRIGIGLVTLLLVSFLVYGLIRAMPGDPAALEALSTDPGANLGVSALEMAELRREYGLDKPWYVAYWDWARKLLSGDLGISLRHRRPVSELILQAAVPTLLLSITSIALSYVIAIPLGLYSTHRAGRLDERIVSVFLYLSYSLPAYVAAVLLVLFLSVKAGWFPAIGLRSYNYETLSALGKVLDMGWHMVLPVICYTYGAIAYNTRFIRNNLAEVIRQDYIRTARAKGLSEVAVLWRHAFRNSLLPFVTMVGLSFPALLSGSVVLERIFAWPGLGRLFFDALGARNYPLIMGLTLTFSVLVLVGTLVADLLYAVADPRISYA